MFQQICLNTGSQTYEHCSTYLRSLLGNLQLLTLKFVSEILGWFFEQTMFYRSDQEDLEEDQEFGEIKGGIHCCTATIELFWLCRLQLSSLPKYLPLTSADDHSTKACPYSLCFVEQANLFVCIQYRSIHSIEIVLQIHLSWFWCPADVQSMFLWCDGRSPGWCWCMLLPYR